MTVAGVEPLSLLFALAAGIVGGAMNALAGGGTFATMPTLIALGLPSPIANATSNVALQPGAMASAWAYRAGLRPLGGLSVRLLAAITFVGGLAGSALLVATPTQVFDRVIPWLLLIATLAIAGGKRLAERFADHATPGPKSLFGMQAVLGVYGGYFGGGVGLMMTAAWGLLAGEPPHKLMAQRTLMLAVANSAATIIFIALGMVRWVYCLPMLAGAIIGGWAGAALGKRLSPAVVRGWTIAVTAVTTAVFFWRAYG
ncbi:sulfite exporter TauE/SafE family protein [Sphingomonas donggukensis]|uniref:Probable membrane transporter protein n=1 Tax=Sphingomonas donggukensis TaxID=2949093 RepID=A0ABY4TYR9_9SPHN|nr:sulfite exporter TauE/SafE family protein [Sphingomonas donggukensis]URW75696.1 sulfite exporter TauE/SafE family protein [Sphingomonas donggukensis]